MSREMDRLKAKWQSGNGWPKRLEWMEINKIRGWTGHRIEFRFPIVAVVGENGSGKSTILQAAAASYKSPGGERKMRFASDFFPDTPWDTIENAEITYQVREASGSISDSVRKPTNRWRGNPNRRERTIHYIDLSRVQPLSARTGYMRLAKPTISETGATPVDERTLQQFSAVMGAEYSAGRYAATDADADRHVPVIEKNGVAYSGFHQGAGELTSLEILRTPFEKYSLVIIDEIESSLHPRMQRRIVRDLANLSREKDIQFIISTHSPYVLSELPADGRILIVETDAGKSTVTGVSPEFAMSRMDSENHPECDLFVEDEESEVLLRELIISKDPTLIPRTTIVPFGKASVGFSLGIMVHEGRFPDPTVVFVDGDQTQANGIHLLPGPDAPEVVVFERMKEINWREIPERLGRSPADVIDSLNRSMTASNPHEWIEAGAAPLTVGSLQLWQALCASWVKHCATDEERESVVEPIRRVLESRAT